MLTIDTSEGIWSSLHDFRMFGDFYALAVLLILGSRRRLRLDQQSSCLGRRR